MEGTSDRNGFLESISVARTMNGLSTAKHNPSARLETPLGEAKERS